MGVTLDILTAYPFMGMPFAFMLRNDLGSQRRYLDALHQHPYAPFKIGRRNWE